MTVPLTPFKIYTDTLTSKITLQETKVTETIEGTVDSFFYLTFALGCTISGGYSH